jgi:hypothetical protein
MKLMRSKTILLAALAFTGSFSTNAQSNSTPGDADYDKFANFIADRNIFDPNRYPHNQKSSTYRPRTHTKSHSSGPQGITLVGTMAYAKGYFAFFNAGDSDLKKVVASGGEIADYTVKEISATTVTLVSKDKKEFAMNIGDAMHQEGSAWKLNSEADSAPANEPATASETDNSNPNAETTADTKTVTPSANLGNNDILKRLMEKRAKENQ